MSSQIARPLRLVATLSAGIAMAVWLWPDQDQASKEPGENPPLVLEDYESEQKLSTGIHEESQHGVKEHADVDDNSDAKTGRYKTVDELATSFMAASSAADAQDVIWAAESYGLAVATDWRKQLDVACNPKELEYISNQNDASQKEFARKLSSYCEGYAPERDFARPMDLDKLDRIFLDLVRNQSRDQLSRDISDVGSSATDDFLVRRLKSANTPEEIHAVGDYLAEYYTNTNHILWRPKARDLPGSGARITNLQQIALELYSCQRFGGCGPDSLKTMRVCAFNLGCETGWNYEQFVFANHSPIEMEYIQEILRHIYSG